MTVVFSDTFTVGADVNIDAYPATPDYAYNNGSGTDLLVNATNDRVELDSNINSAFRSAYIIDPSVPTGNQEITLTGYFIGPWTQCPANVRSDTGGANSFYAGTLEYGTTNEVEIYRVTNGSWVLIASADQSTEGSGGSSHTLRMRATGSGATISLEFQIDSQSNLTFDDTAGGRFTSGYPGFAQYHGSGIVSHTDNISVDDLASGATNITAAEDNQAQASDPATLGVFTPITPTESSQAQTSDAASISFSSPGITVGEGAQLQASDQALVYSTFYGSQGPLYPGTASSASIPPYSGLTWVATSVNNIRADDAAYASLTSTSFDAGTVSYLLQGWNFGATIPTAATINGMLVEIAKWYSAGSAQDIIVTAISGPGTIAGDNLGTLGVNWPSSIATITYGGPTSTWGVTPTPAMLNGTSFGFAIAGSAVGANTDIWVDFIRATYYYTVTDGVFGITPEQGYQAQVADVPDVTSQEPPAGTPITVDEGHQAQATDAATITAIHPVAPIESNQAQVSDSSILGVITPLAPAEANQSQASDASTFGVITPVSGVDHFQAQASDAASLVAITPITPAEGKQAQASDLATVSAAGATNITPAEAAQAQASDAATLGVIVPLATAEGKQAQASDLAALVVITPIAPIDSFQAQVSDPAGITPVYLLTAGEAAQAQVSDPAILTSGGISITPAEGKQAQVSDAASVSFTATGETYNITVVDATQPQTSDPAGLLAIYPLAPAQANQAQVSDILTLASYAPTYNVTVIDATQAQVSDFAPLGAITPIGAAEANQAQSADLITLILANLILHGERRLYGLNKRTTSSLGKRPVHSIGAREDLEVDDE